MNRDRLRQQVECPVCMEQFRTPKQLPCQHSFCLQCLQNVHDSNGERRVRCPECRTEHRIPANGIAGFPTSVPIQRLIGAMVPTQQPSAPPVSVTIRNYEPTADHDVVRTISVLEEQQHLLRDTRAVQAQRDRSRTQGLNQDAPHISYVQEVSENTRRITFQTVRHAYRRYLGFLFLRNEELVKLRIVPVMLIITLSRFIAGAVKLGSDCHDEYNVAKYSFVKAWFEVFFYGILSVFYFKTNIERTLNNKFVQIWMLIYALFTVVWFSLGTAWVFGKYAEMTTECPKDVKHWTFHFINFILFLTGVDWIGVFILVFYSLYCLCDTDDDDDDAY